MSNNGLEERKVVVLREQRDPGEKIVAYLTAFEKEDGDIGGFGETGG